MLERKDRAIAEAVARRRWRAGDARVLIEAWRQSGQTLTAFARSYDVHPERLGRWHRLLRTQLQGSEPVRFHPVQVRPVQPRRAEPGEKIELVLLDGRAIRVPHGFAADDLRRVLHVLEAEA
jgi:transposase-like protein